MLVLDFETKSRCDLLTAGTYNYTSDPSTDILCMAVYDMETHYKEIWYPEKGPLSERIKYSLNNADFIVAHYAEFDQGIYECIGVPDYGFPEISRERWYCSASQARVNALPAGLDDAAWALGLTQRKYATGKHLIKKLSIPQEDGTFNQDPQLHAEMREYCMQDVEVTVGVVNGCRLMTVAEHEDWLKTCEINERGVACDLELAQLALRYAKAEQDEIAAEMKRITKGAVERHTQNARIKTWLVGQLGELHPVIQAMTVYKNGKAKQSLDKNIRRTMLAMADDGVIEIPDDAVDMIQLLDDGSKSSVAKFKRMIQRADPEDSRVRGAFVFAGAGQTLRYASRGLQLHNMRRDCWTPEETELIVTRMRNNAPLDTQTGTVLDTLSKLLRPAIVPAKGNVLVVGDWSSIEARCLHWGTDTEQGDDKLDLFASGVDVYQEVADDLRLDDRQQGKVVELSAGYQGGYRAFQAMARNYGVKVSDDVAKSIIERWRSKNYHVTQFWAELETAAKMAIAHPGEEFGAGMMKYVFAPHLMDGTLLGVMPGDHFMQYPNAKVELVKTPWGDQNYQVTALKASYHPKADAKAWPRAALYGGLLCENFCQGFSAALLRNAVRTLPDVIAHVHDEIVMEVSEEDADEAADVLRSVMLDVPAWAEGLPLNAEPTIMVRYGKD